MIRDSTSPVYFSVSFLVFGSKMAGSQPIVLDLPRECCSFVDENEAFDVQFLMGGRVICFSYGKEAFTTFWIVVDGFYGTKKIVM